MSIPRIRAATRAVHRRDAGAQLAMMHAVFNGAGPLVSGKVDGFNAESQRLMAQSTGESSTKPKDNAFKRMARALAGK